MDKREAKQIIEKELDAYRAKSYTELVQMIGTTVNYHITTPWGTWYQIEIDVRWEREPGGSLWISGAIDDGGRSAFSPLWVGFFRDISGNVDEMGAPLNDAKIRVVFSSVCLVSREVLRSLARGFSRRTKIP